MSKVEELARVSVPYLAKQEQEMIPSERTANSRVRRDIVNLMGDLL